MSQQLVEQLRTWGQDPNVRHFLDVVIPGAEGTTTHGYNTAFGGDRFDSLADHPRYLKPFKQTDGKTNYTSAAGKYQFLSNTWDETAKALGLSDFGPESQDLGALYLLHQRGVLPDLQRGDFKTAVNKTGSVWASLPSSNYPQPKRDAGFIEGLVNKMIPAAQAGTLPPQQQSRATPPAAAPIQGNTTMDQSPQISALPNARSALTQDPMAMYRMLLSQQSNVPVQELSPEQKQALLGGRQQRAAMLPLAIGASLAGDKRVAALGGQLYQDASEARGAMQLGNEGWLTSEGQLIQNPFTQANRQENNQNRALSLTMSLLRGQNAPPGYTWATGTNGQPELKFIPGGPGDPDVKKASQEPTEDEKKSAGYGLRIERGQNTISEVTGRNKNAASPEVLANTLGNIPVFGENLANVVVSNDRQQVEAAQLDILDAALTLNTGAAYTKEQLKGLSKSYFPQIGDTDETIAGKQARLNDLLQTAKLRAGRMQPRVDNLPPSTGNTSGSPSGFPSADAIAAELKRREGK
jgi:muramidase (phage lysozyme)